MEALAYQMLQIGEAGSLAVSWVIMVLAAALTVDATRYEWRIGRTKYFLLLGLIWLLSGLSNLLAVAVPGAVKGQYLGPVVILIYALLVPLGAIAGVFSAARSQDVYGTRNKWIYGFIPIANLVLLFGKPQESRPGGAMRAIASTTMVLAGLLLILMGKGIEKGAERAVEQARARMADDPVAQRMAMRLEIKAYGMEKALREFASGITLPMTIDSITTLTGVNIKDNSLTYVYEVNSSKSNFNDSWHDIMMSNTCTSDSLRDIIALGAIVSRRYDSPSKKTLGEVTASTPLCGSWREQFDAKFVRAAESIRGPMVVDEITTLDRASYASNTFTYHYSLSQTLPQGWQNEIKGNFCQSPQLKAMLTAGLTVRAVYRMTTGSTLGEVSVAKSDCP